ncbi:MAG: STY4851/ECs_5259 family protein, partial [Candidatus Pacebacteria bacterium]|nr:STY4851/ECs_5259 family protein [Candidatus Paceibacterota bacterium]
MTRPIELKDSLKSLLEARGLARPDRRPLYAYRFSKAEVDQICTIMHRHGPSALRDPNGAALVVAHVAEWFRRERAGGHWDWIRPLQALGFEYGPHAPVQYRDIEDLVSLGLRAWGRPEPTGGERLLAIIREAGFPVASVREDPRISSWLKFSVLCAERGFSTRDAVGAEAWRVSDRLAQALFEPAIELCEKIIELRRSLPPANERGDPVDYLDQNRPCWRDELPFDIECEDIRSMVEQIVRIRDEVATALGINRNLFRIADEWRARASLCLSGRIDLRRLPPLVAEAVRDGRRLRIFPRPPYCDELIAVGAIETFGKDGSQEHELRAFVAKFDAPLALEEEARLLVQSGISTVGELIATGGEALHEPVIALQIEQIDELGNPVCLRVLGSSPVQTSRSVLALAIREEHFAAVSFSDKFNELGRCVESSRRVVSFSGLATFALDGARWSWRTTADRNVEARPVLVGNLVRNVRECVFRGVPQLWIEREGHFRAPKHSELHWRPRGRGRWRPVDGSKPWGNVDIAVIERGELCCAIGAAIVPPAFNIAVDRTKRELRVTGLDT